MDTPGKYLKKEREIRNLSLKEVSQVIRVKEHFLWAIEEDRYDLLPPPIYVKGFLANYGRYLGLDPKEINQIYQNYLNSINPPHIQEVKKEKKIIKKNLLIILIIFLILLSFLVWKLFIIPQNINKIIDSQSQHLSLKSTQTTENKELKENLEEKREFSVNLQDNIKKNIPEVIEAYTGTGISKEGERLILTGKTSEFTCNNQKIYFFTRIKTDKENKVLHVWFWMDKEFQKIDLEIKPPLWGTYSYLTLRPNMSGPWRVELRYGDEVLKTLFFKAYKPQ